MRPGRNDKKSHPGGLPETDIFLRVALYDYIKCSKKACISGCMGLKIHAPRVQGAPLISDTVTYKDPLRLFKKSRVVILVVGFSLSSHRYGRPTPWRYWMRIPNK